MAETTDDFTINEPAARQALAELGYDADACELSWLSGGGAHKNFRVRTEEHDAVLKLWNRMWEGVGVLPPAHVIMANTRIASDLGVGARVVGTSCEPMALMLDYVPSTVLSPAEDGWAGELAGAARSLHTSGARFVNDYSPFGEARKMLASARHRDASFPDGFESVAAEIDRLERVLDLRLNEFVPCHNDLYGPNILKKPDGGICLIDYDLSGNGDRFYDLGFAATYFEMDEDTIHRFCESYFGEHDVRLVARVRLFSAAADWNAVALWLVASSMADTNDDYDYAGELRNSLRRLDQTFGGTWYGDALQAARR